MALLFVILVRMLYHCAITDSPEQRTSNKVHLTNVSVFFILLAWFNGLSSQLWFNSSHQMVSLKVIMVIRPV